LWNQIKVNPFHSTKQPWIAFFVGFKFRRNGEIEKIVFDIFKKAKPDYISFPIFRKNPRWAEGRFEAQKKKKTLFVLTEYKYFFQGSQTNSAGMWNRKSIYMNSLFCAAARKTWFCFDRFHESNSYGIVKADKGNVYDTFRLILR
jgi:hypothetical protein